MVSPPVRMTIEWYLPLGQARPITMALHSVIAETRAVRGCVRCSVSTGISTEGTVTYVEEWETEEDLRNRLRAETFTELAALIDAAAKPPRVVFALPWGTRGLEFAEEVRRNGKGPGSNAQSPLRGSRS
jgi:quinol monooxygenase YgiN